MDQMSHDTDLQSFKKPEVEKIIVQKLIYCWSKS